MGIKDFVLYYLNQNESEEFAKWAIGDNYKTIFREDWPKFWNERHSEELKIFPYGNPINDLQNMIKLWKENENRRTET